MVRIVFCIIIRLIRRCTGVGVMPVFISLVSIAYLMSCLFGNWYGTAVSVGVK